MNEYGGVFASLIGLAIEEEDADSGKKIIFSDEDHFDIGRYVRSRRSLVGSVLAY